MKPFDVISQDADSVTLRLKAQYAEEAIQAHADTPLPDCDTRTKKMLDTLCFAASNLLNDQKMLVSALKRASKKLGEQSCSHNTEGGDYREGIQDDCANCIINNALSKVEVSTPNERLYRVEFAIDCSAVSPERAAKRAWELLTGPNAMLPVASVVLFDSDGEAETVDLQELAESEAIPA